MTFFTSHSLNGEVKKLTKLHFFKNLKFKVVSEDWTTLYLAVQNNDLTLTI